MKKIKNFLKKIHKKARVVGWYKALFLCLLEKISFNTYKRYIYSYLESFFINELNMFKDSDCFKMQKCVTRYVFVCWWQGENHAPPIVKKCVRSIKQFCIDNQAKFVFIHKDNYDQWVDIPEAISNKVGSLISITEFSDLLRMALLKRYGGVWIDSTIFYSGKLESSVNPFEQEFYSQKHRVYPDHLVNISQGMWASYILGTRYCDFPLYVLAEKMYIKYYSAFDTNIDYFVIDYIIRLCYEHIPFIQKCINDLMPNNEDIFWLYRYSKSQKRKEEFEIICKRTMFHKLNWRIELTRDENSLIDKVFKTDDKFVQ